MAIGVFKGRRGEGMQKNRRKDFATDDERIKKEIRVCKNKKKIKIFYATRVSTRHYTWPSQSVEGLKHVRKGWKK